MESRFLKPNLPVRKTDLYLLLKNRRSHRVPDQKTAGRAIRPLWMGALSLVLVVLALALLAAGFLYARVTAGLPSLDVLPVLLNPVDGELLQPTTITDRSGETILFTLENPGIQRRYLAVNPEKPDHFNPQLVRAVVAKLDPTFWENPGYSLEDWQNPEPATIAERLVSELLLWQEPDSTARAIRMRLLAAQLVSRYGRTQVLEWYLNSAWFGHLAVGAESASQLYFQKSALDLDLAESAMLAVLLEAPALNPLDSPILALEMQRQFLAEMAQTQTITLDEFSAALREELTLRASIAESSSLAPAFTRRLLQSLEDEFGQNRLQRGGLVVTSSLDLDLQRQFICTARTQLIRLQGETLSGYAYDDEECETALLLPTQSFAGLDIGGLAAAGVVLNPQTGEVLAYVEPTTSTGEVKADSGYEPGSLLTPFAALAGFARGLSPASLQWDVPAETDLSTPAYTNPDGAYHGAVSLRSAIANDYLVAIMDELNQAGVYNAWYLASTLGLTSLSEGDEPADILFGGAPSSLLEVAAAYGTLANSGISAGALDDRSGQISPSLVISVKSTTGRIQFDHTTADGSSVLSRPLAYLINHVLSDENARWPSLGFPNPLEIGQTAAAKMGVIASQQQVWTVGYTPERLVLVWLGDSASEQAQPLDPLMAAGIWHAMIKGATAGLSNPGWAVPEGVSAVEVCVPSGMLPSVDCPSTMQEVFVSGNEPTQPDTLYERIKVNRETGQRATVFTDPALIEEQLFINVPTKAHNWAVDAGLAVAPTGYDAISTMQTDPEVQITSPAIFSPVGGQVAIRGLAYGDNFASYTVQVGEGINPDSWLQIGTGTKAVSAEGDLAQWDTTGLDGLHAVRLTVVAQDQSVRSSTIQVTVDNTPPTVKINYPAADQQVQAVDGVVTLLADIQDGTGIQSVEWRLDGKLVATQTAAPWLYRMPAGEGGHTLQLTAIDSAGNKTTTNQLKFSVLE